MQIQTGNHKVSGDNTISEDSKRAQAGVTPRETPFSHLVFNPQKDADRVLQHCKEVFHALNFNHRLTDLYSQALDQKVMQLAQCIEQPQGMWRHDKVLFLDLDETLILRSLTPTSHSFSLTICDPSGTPTTIYFKVRPYAFEFLKNMSLCFDLILFTAAEENYAKAFFDFFNERANNVLKEYLCRDFCIKAYKNIFFKDIRIIRSRDLKDMVLLDNSAYSFGPLVSNGIPIMSYDGSDEDMELKYVQEYLKKVSKAKDVRSFNRQHLRLFQMVQVCV